MNNNKRIKAINAIVAVDKNWAIGNNNRLLVHLSGDLKYFKSTTLGNTLVMGRKTLESLPGGKPLPGRSTLVLTTNKKYEVAEGATVFYSMNEMLNYINSAEDIGTVFVAGGESIYEQMLPYCNSIYVTKIDEEFPADSYFPNMDDLVRQGKYSVAPCSGSMEEKGISYRFFVYSRI